MAEEAKAPTADDQMKPDLSSGGPGRVEPEGISSFAAFEAEQAAAAAGSAEEKPTEEIEEVEEAPATEGVEEAAEGAETPPKKEVAAESKPAPKAGKKSAKERINEVVAQRSEAERRADAAEARAAAAEERAAALERGEKPDSAAAETPAAEGIEPDPDKYEYGSLDPAYQKAVREFDKAELRKEMNASRQAEAASAKAAELDAKFDVQVEALEAEVGDYVEKVVVGSDPNNPKWACSVEMSSLIKGSDVGARVAYHLASHPAESIALSKKSPLEQAAWFGRKEAEFTAPPTKGKPTKVAAVSQADPPADPVRGSGGKFKANPATTDFAAFEKAHQHLLNQ